MKSLRREAMLWHILMRGAGPDHPDRPKFEAWLDADPAHRETYHSFLGVLDRIEAPGTYDALADAMEARKASRRRTILKGGAAALVFALIGGETWRYAAMYRIDWSLDAGTATGEVRTLTLADGSTITLGAQNHVAVVFSKAMRAVRLDRGEAIFSVARDGNRPFVVDARGMRVTVLGTRFAVALLADRVRVSVDRGQVEVMTGTFWRRRTVILGAGQVAEAAFTDGTAGPPEIIARSAAAAFSFAHGAISFDRADLHEIAAVLSRYRSAPVRVVAGGKFRISALVQADNVEGFLRNLPHIAPVRVTIAPGNGLAVLSVL